jgi:hypothetical protein
MEKSNGKEDKQGRVTLFRKPGRMAFPPEGHGAGEQPAEAPAHPVEAYARMLKKEGFVSEREYEQLALAIAPLLRLVPDLPQAAVAAIRKEMGRPENNKHVLRDKEESFWKAALGRNLAPIPGFDLNASLACFRVRPEEDKDRTVVFLRPEHRRSIPPYVPPSLRMGDVFFYVILRMFRYHLHRRV